MKQFFTIMVVLLGCLVFLAGCDSSQTKSSRSSRTKSVSKRGTASAPPKVSVRAPRPTKKQPVDEDTADPDEEDPADTDVDPFGGEDSSDDGDGTSTPDEQPEEENTSPPEEEPEVQPEPEEDPDTNKPMTAEDAKQAIIDLDGRVATDEAGNVITVFLNRSSARSNDLEMLEYLPEVTSLNITGLRLDDESLEYIGKMPRLERLYPAHTKITDDALDKLKADKPDLKVYK